MWRPPASLPPQPAAGEAAAALRRLAAFLGRALPLCRAHATQLYAGGLWQRLVAAPPDTVLRALRRPLREPSGAAGGAWGEWGRGRRGGSRAEAGGPRGSGMERGSPERCGCLWEKVGFAHLTQDAWSRFKHNRAFRGGIAREEALTCEGGLIVKLHPISS